MPVGKPRPSHPHALPPTCEPTFVFGFSAESISCLLQRQESPDRVPPKRVVLQATMKLKETKSRHKPPSRKFQTKGIKVVGKWKQVEIDPNVFADGQMDDLVCFEELTDYQLVSPGKNPSSLFSEPSPKKRKAQVVSEKEAEEEGGESSCPKKKMKLKKQKDGLVTEGTTSQKELEMKDAEPEPQGADIACSDPKVEEMVSDNLVQTVLKKKKNKGKRAHSQSTVPKLPKTVKTWMPDVHDQKADVSAWKDLFVPKPVLQALSFLGFSAPTPIQALTLAPAIRDKLDILGAAETGSGKTLAFAIPMIHAVLQWHKGKASPIACNTGVPSGEMKTEARTEAGTLPDETGIQNKDPLSEAGAKARAKSGASVSDQELVFHDGGDGDDAGEGPSFLVKEEPVPEQKENEEKLDEEQTEELNQELDNNSGTYKVRPRRPLLGLVLTPTRELAVQVKQHIDAVAKFTGIKTAILVGGMSTQKQQRMLNRHPEIVVATPGRLWELIKEKHSHVSNLRQLRCLVVDEADRMVEKGHFAELSQLLEILNDSQYNPKRQTLVFSATLTLVHQAPARILHKKHIKKMDKTAKLDLLMQKIGLRGKPKVIDLTRNEGTVETLTETKIHCEADEKDFYLYYFLMQYPGRSLVFANSISCIKRLSGLLKVLDIMPLTLHACMHQKQRLRNLEQFARLEDCVLLATDVAARGLDIPEVQHVIHYQVPRTSEIYIHRSGRTARATREGLSLMLIGPEDVINFKKIYKTLKKDEDIPLFPVQTKYMDIVKERIRLARQIEKAEYRNFQACLHNSWLEQAAAALEIELEEDMYKGGKADLQEERRRQKQMKVLKKELRHLLAQPLFKEELRTKYPTQSGRLPQLVAAPRKGESALSCLSKQKKKQLKGRQQEPQPSTSAS